MKFFDLENEALETLSRKFGPVVKDPRLLTCDPEHPGDLTPTIKSPVEK